MPISPVGFSFRAGAEHPFLGIADAPCGLVGWERDLEVAATYRARRAALHPGDRTARQGGPAPAATARLMPHLPVGAGHPCQRHPLMPSLPARLVAGFLPQRPRPRRLAQPLAGWRLGGIPRVLPQPRLKLSDPLPGPLQLRPRLRQLLAQRHHQPGQHVIRRRSLLSGHTRTLRAKITKRTHPRPAACRPSPPLPPSADGTSLMPAAVRFPPVPVLAHVPRRELPTACLPLVRYGDYCARMSLMRWSASW